MKKYILIKEYPGSPDLWSVCEEINIGGDYLLENSRSVVLKTHVENQPEYWYESDVEEMFLKYQQIMEDDFYNAVATYKPSINYESIIEEYKHHFNYLYKTEKSFIGFKDKLTKKERKLINAKLIWERK
jgi:chromatin segregation and condensation protein Rec8/ScpA/Scc1 (kleisin family)